MKARCSIYVVDSDAGTRRCLVKSLKTWDWDVRPFAAGGDFLEALDFLSSGICIIELRLSDMDGMNVLRELRAVRPDILAIVTAADADIRAAVQTIKEGASDFLEKPFKNEFFFRVLEDCFSEWKRKVGQSTGDHNKIKRFHALSKREVEVMFFISEAKDNFEVADHFGISVRTVESYRSRIINKIGVRRFSDALLLLTNARLTRNRLLQDKSLIESMLPQHGNGGK